MSIPDTTPLAESSWHSGHEVTSHLGMASHSVYPKIERKQPSRIRIPFGAAQ